MATETFCVAPWVHLYVHPTGEVKPCCIGTSKIGDTKINSLKEIWDSDTVKEYRKKFLAGDFPSNCDTCARFEKNGIHSLRQSLNLLFQDELEELKSQTLPDGGMKEFKLKYIDVRYSNFCNFKCRSCYDEYSSAILNEDNKEKNKEGNIIIFPGKDENELVTQVLDHVEHAKKIYFAGGEPLIQPEHWKVLDKLIELGKTDVELYYNTNLSSLKYKDKNILNYWKKFTNIIVAASIDGWNEAAEFWRSGTKWNTIADHVQQIQQQTPHVRLGTTTTIGWPNLWNALEFIDHCIDTNFIDPNFIYINVLQGPEVYSLTSLPAFKKIAAKNRITETLNKLKTLKLDNGLLYSNLSGLISFIDSKSTEGKLKVFNDVTSRLDRLRNENFFEAFPEHNDMKPYLL